MLENIERVVFTTHAKERLKERFPEFRKEKIEQFIVESQVVQKYANSVLKLYNERYQIYFVVKLSNRDTCVSVITIHDLLKKEKV